MYLQLVAVLLIENKENTISLLNKEDSEDITLLREWMNIEINNRWNELVGKNEPALKHLVKSVAFITLCRGIEKDQWEECCDRVLDKSPDDKSVLSQRIRQILDVTQNDFWLPFNPDLLGGMLLACKGEPMDRSGSGIFKLANWGELACNTSREGFGQTLLLLSQDFLPLCCKDLKLLVEYYLNLCDHNASESNNQNELLVAYEIFFRVFDYLSEHRKPGEDDPYEEYMKSLQRALDVEGSDPTPLKKKGDMLWYTINENNEFGLTYKKMEIVIRIYEAYYDDKDHIEIAERCCSVADICLRYRKLKEAVEYYEKAYKIMLIHNKKRAVNILLKITAIYYNQYKYRTALYYARKSYKIVKHYRLKETDVGASLFNDIGFILMRLGTFKKAEFYLLKAREYFEAHNGNCHKSTLAIGCNLWEIYGALGDIDKKQYYINLFLKNIDKSTRGNLLYLLPCFESLAEQFLMEDNYEDSFKILRLAHKICEEASHHDQQYLQKLSRACLQLDLPIHV